MFHRGWQGYGNPPEKQADSEVEFSRKGGVLHEEVEVFR